MVAEEEMVQTEAVGIMMKPVVPVKVSAALAATRIATDDLSIAASESIDKLHLPDAIYQCPGLLAQSHKMGPMTCEKSTFLHFVLLMALLQAKWHTIYDHHSSDGRLGCCVTPTAVGESAVTLRSNDDHGGSCRWRVHGMLEAALVLAVVATSLYQNAW